MRRQAAERNDGTKDRSSDQQTGNSGDRNSGDRKIEATVIVGFAESEMSLGCNEPACFGSRKR